jgi:S1-C subfamily serine protease
MSEVQPQISELPQGQPQEQSQIQSAPVPPARSGFSGKQVVGIMFGVLVLLAIGLAIGGAIGYRMGSAEGARQAVANLPAAQPQAQQAPSQQSPRQQTPRSFTVPVPQQPFNGRQLPALNPGGPYLGVTFQMITPTVATQEGITGTTGALVREVVADGPAAQAGLKQGDVIIAVNGKAIDDKNDLRSRVAEFKPNDEITLTVVKGTANGPTDQRDVKVKLGERPVEQSFGFQLPFDGNGLPQLPEGFPQLPFNGQGQPEQAPAVNGPYLGVEFEMITPEVAARENITGTQGALIKTVVADSPAAKAGLKAGEVITAVDSKNISDANNLRDIVQSHKSGDEITLTVVTGTATGPTNRHDVQVTLAARPAQRQFQMPPGIQPGVPSLDSREG